jgi:hypothetical protein
MWEVNGTVVLGAQIKDATQTLVTPSTIVLTITLPDGSTATPTPTVVSTGIYSATYVPTVPGRFGVRWVTTGPATAYTDVFNVQEAAPPLILSLDETRAYLNFATGQTADDEELREFIEAATRAVEQKVGAVVRRTVTTTIYPGSEVVRLPLAPVISLTSAAIVRTGTTVDITNFVEEYGCLRSKTFAPLPYEPWTLTYVAGRTVTPANIRNVTAAAIKDLWASQRGAGGRRAGQSDAGSRLSYVLSYQALEELRPDLLYGELAGFA